jgi:hypothetical protein
MAPNLKATELAPARHLVMTFLLMETQGRDSRLRGASQVRQSQCTSSSLPLLTKPLMTSWARPS